MPELPEVEALAHHLREHAVGRRVHRVDVSSLQVLKTFTPPWTELQGREVTGAGRFGKHLDLDCDGLHLVVHLARAGWLRWSEHLSAAPPKPGRGPLALRVHLGPPGEGPGFDLTEAGTKKGLAAWVVTDPADVPGIARLGPDALSITRTQLEDLFAGRTERLKTALTDQAVLAGVGNAYSDEIMHTARLSPYATAGKLPAEALDRLHEALVGVLTDAVARSVGQSAATLKGEKRSGLRVHARTGLPCPVCGDVVREVSFADKAFQYCPTCQTGGKPLADRRMSRLLK
ncbi:Fpg/Nei family DNA glycosylase [Saccharothrix sp. 6-C]|uniref:Formamidopyrimidine-DNA glycosylase n=1 Tax=Saccharothrix texasensis TaxID=103734 RepID=A0A3N1H9N8_9PSEU|nr:MULTISPECIES: DNA-formamidopyrimidine glycosylase family protein [Saccharothrix]QQQ76533.1 Fpg/Nei family DNA glycosylase [Saccharothrix sp. 6-C]ROP39245.1 formamidopyrimidine-DNA glycosylase [Saccharothrix texasensis]